MFSPEHLAAVAGLLTTGAFVPQVVKTVRSRSAKDISLGMFLAFTVGVALWIVYGALTGSAAIAAYNGITLALSGTILAVKLREVARGGRPASGDAPRGASFGVDDTPVVDAAVEADGDL